MRIVSWNVLADAYVRPEYFPHTPPRVLLPGRRVEPLIARIEVLAPDVLCLQEVEPSLFAVLAARLGMTARFAQRSNKPEGCATFVRAPLGIGSVQEVRFTDGSDSLALLVTVSGHIFHPTFTVANTRLKWDPPCAPLDRQRGFQQISELVSVLGERSAAAETRVVCGDFNATPDSLVCAVLRNAGLVEPFAGRDGAWTANPNGVAKRIDFVFHSPIWRPRAVDPPEINAETPLPSETEPSDHLPVVVDFA